MLYDHPRAFSPCIVGRANDKKFGRVIRRLSWRIIPCTSIYARTALNLYRSGKETGGELRCLLMRNRNPNRCIWEKERVLWNIVWMRGEERTTERTNKVTRHESVAVIPLKLEGCYCDYRFRTNLQLDQPRRPFVRVFSPALSRCDLFDEKLHTWNVSIVSERVEIMLSSTAHL